MGLLYVLGLPLSDDYRTTPDEYLDIVRRADLLIGEERKNTIRLMKAASADVAYVLLNEHSSKQDRLDLLGKINGLSKTVFFSDGGTPCISDPDYRFIDMCHNSDIEVISLPGPSSITTALSLSGFPADTFYFAGFPPRDEDKRRQFYKNIKNSATTTVFFERPYALKRVAGELRSIGRMTSVSINIGTPSEATFRGNPPGNIPPIKAPFVVVVSPK